MVEVTLTTHKPEPAMSDFPFQIDLKRSEGSASRVFTATRYFILACERLDPELLSSIDSNIETVMVLEDNRSGFAEKTWLRHRLSAIDDQAWKSQVGKYLVSAKYAILRWIDSESTPKDLAALQHNLRRLAAETNVRHLPDYAPVRPDALLDAVESFQKSQK